MIYYLSCTDEVITQRQKEVKELNDRLIAEHNKLPFWRRFFEATDLSHTVTQNWYSFNIWMNNRIAQKKKANVVQLEIREVRDNG